MSRSRSGSGPLRTSRRLGALALAAMALAGCSTLERMSRVGEAPELSPVQNPASRPDYRPVSMPMPAPITAARTANSLWRPGSRALFKDLRASQVGDIVTVVIAVDDKAQLENASARSRVHAEDASAGALLGHEHARAEEHTAEPQPLMRLS